MKHNSFIQKCFTNSEKDLRFITQIQDLYCVCWVEKGSWWVSSKIDECLLPLSTKHRIWEVDQGLLTYQLETEKNNLVGQSFATISQKPLKIWLCK